jgi:hypothetical protein
MKTGKTLQELAIEVQRQQESKVDFTAPSSKLRFHGDHGALRMEAAGVGDFAINNYAHGQIAVNAAIPKQYYDRVLQSNPALLASHVNHWFSTEPKKHLVRTLDKSTRALLSDRYRPLDNFDLLTSILPMIIESHGHMVVASSEVTERKLYLKLAVPSLVEAVKVGDEVTAGVVISNSEVGDGSLSVDPFITRLVCLNGMKVDKFGQRRNHVGKSLSSGEDAAEFYQDDTRAADDRAFFLKVRDTVRGVLEPAGFHKIVDSLRESTEKKIEAKPEDAVEILANKYQLNQGTRDGIFRQLIDGGLGLNQYSLVQAITRQAQDEESYDDASRLESLGGTVLPLNPSEWKVIAPASEMVPARRKRAA